MRFSRCFLLQAVSAALNEKAASVEGVQQWPYRSVAQALEVIPRTIIQNCGANVVRTLTKLRVCTAVMPLAQSHLNVHPHFGASLGTHILLDSIASFFFNLYTLAGRNLPAAGPLHAGIPFFFGVQVTSCHCLYLGRPRTHKRATRAGASTATRATLST